MNRSLLPILLVVSVAADLSATSLADAPFHVSPRQVSLSGPESSQQLLVSGSDSANTDLTRMVRYLSADPAVVEVTESGRILTRSEGTTEILIQSDHGEVRVPVTVTGVVDPEPVSFRHQIIPILSKAGCNSGGCHGKAEGQNGFKLSVFGFDADADYAALTKEGRGRRASIVTPEDSLLIRKGTATEPHGGGRKIIPNSIWHRRLVRWMREGARLDDESSPHVTAIEVEPARVVMTRDSRQQLRVTAIDATGRRSCVTAEAEYQSNAEAIADVDRDGLVSVSTIPGEAAILVRYMGHVAVSRVTLPQSGNDFQRPPENNFIDGAVWDKLASLNVVPSEQCDDATFLRRVYLDTIATLPTVDEARRFLDDDSPGKRSHLIDKLLDRDEYADYQAMRWADILRVDKSIVTPQGAVAITRWLRRQFRQNTPYDQFARTIVTAQGNSLAEGPASFFQVHKDPQMSARAVSQVFLGVRIQCAQCHHHPFERWSQHDYYAFAGLFTGIGRKGGPTGGQKIFSTSASDLKHPRTDEPVAPAGLGAEPVDAAQQIDRRVHAADWITSPNNPFFARMIANRVWARYLGRGLVEPIDDLRETNPATNEPLLDALSGYLTEQHFDLRELTRAILNSRVYQLSSRPNESNELDEQNFSHASWKAQPAEVLLDAIGQSTEIPEQFNGWPEGTRAIRVWDNRMPSYFFRIFGRPQRVSVCECERGNEPSIAQALHLMNSPEAVRKIRHRDGRAARLATSDQTDGRIIEELYLATLSRFPSDREVALMKQAFGQPGPGGRRAAVEDILWTLLNTKEFVYNH